jgi:hypothetical protein
LNTPPDECPNSALNWFCSTVNSATASFGTVMIGPVTSLRLLSTPSMVKLLLRGRWPPMAGPVPTPTPPELVTPALSSDRLRRPPVGLAAAGRSYAIFAWKLLATCEVDVSTALVASATSTVVVTLPTSSFPFAAVVLFNSTSTSRRVRVENPVAVTLTEYRPIRTLLNR